MEKSGKDRTKSKNKLGLTEGTLDKLKPKEGEEQNELLAWEMVTS